MSIVIGPLILVGVLPAVGQSKSPDPQIQLAVDANVAPERDTYTRKAQDEMREWRQKLRGIGEAVKMKEQEAGAATESGLKRAWIKNQGRRA